MNTESMKLRKFSKKILTVALFFMVFSLFVNNIVIVEAGTYETAYDNAYKSAKDRGATDSNAEQDGITAGVAAVDAETARLDAAAGAPSQTVYPGRNVTNQYYGSQYPGAQAGASIYDSSGGTTECGTQVNDGKICNPIKAKSLSELVMALLQIVKFVAGIALVFFFIYAGFMYVMARGDEGKIKEATARLKWTAIGGAILLGAEVIARLIIGTIGQLTNGL